MSQQTARRGGATWALIITSVAGFMAALDNLVVTTALPSIRRDLGGALDDLEWTVSAYTLTFAVLLMFGAALGDRFGRRRLFLVGLSIFTGASAAAAMAPGLDSLIAARAVQGVGAAIMMPLTLTLLTAAVPAAKRGMAYGIWGAVNGLAVASGPLIGGSLTEHVSWHWIFWLNVPLGLALLPLARLRLAESHGTGAPLDITGTLLVSGGLFGIVYGLVRGPAEGWTSLVVLTGLLAGAALLTGFIIHGIRAKNPMLPMRLFPLRAFAGIDAASLLMFLGMFGSISCSAGVPGVLGLRPPRPACGCCPGPGCRCSSRRSPGTSPTASAGIPWSPPGSSCRPQGSRTTPRGRRPRLVRRPAARPDRQRHRNVPVLRPGLQPGHVQRPSAGAGHRLGRQQRAA